MSTIDGQLLQMPSRHGSGSGPPLLLFNGIGAIGSWKNHSLERLPHDRNHLDVPGVALTQPSRRTP